MGKFKELDIVAQDEVESRIRMDCDSAYDSTTDMQLDEEYAREYAEWAAEAAKKFKEELERTVESAEDFIKEFATEPKTENVWAIMHRVDNLLYWEDGLGWTNSGFTLFSTKDKNKYTRPVDGIWVHFNSL